MSTGVPARASLISAATASNVARMSDAERCSIAAACCTPGAEAAWEPPGGGRGEGIGGGECEGRGGRSSVDAGPPDGRPAGPRALAAWGCARRVRPRGKRSSRAGCARSHARTAVTNSAAPHLLRRGIPFAFSSAWSPSYFAARSAGASGRRGRASSTAMVRPRSLGMADPMARGGGAGGALGPTSSCDSGSPLRAASSAPSALSSAPVAAPSAPIATVAASRGAPAAPNAGLPNAIEGGAGRGRRSPAALPGGASSSATCTPPRAEGVVPFSTRASSASGSTLPALRGQDGRGGRGPSRTGRRREVPCGTGRLSTKAM